MKRKCSKCGNTEFSEDTMDLMGDGKEEHFGKTAVFCSGDNGCGYVVEYLD